jgi:hypothetical protein
MSTVRRSDKCPLCGKPASAQETPFCGQGCRDRDLLRWLGEDYRIPGPPAEDEDMSLDKRDDGAL